MVKKDSLNIAYICWEFPPIIYGGLGVYARDLTKEMVKAGHNLTVFTTNDERNYPVKSNWNGIDVYRPEYTSIKTSIPPFLSENILSWGEGGIDFLSDMLCFNHAVSILIKSLNEKKKFDIIVAHDWLDLPGGIAAKEATGLPLVYHVHATEVGRSLGNPTWELVNLELIGGREADRVITVSYAMKDEMTTTGFSEEKIRVCHNAVDTYIFDPKRVKKDRKEKLKKEFNIKKDETVLFYVGRLEPMKGVDNLVSAMPIVLKEHPDTKLIILGRGTLEDKIKSMRQELRIEDKIILDTRFVDDEAKIHYYAIADCCIFPSLYEPFGIVALEAMAMEKPLVVGAHGTSGLRESVIVPPSANATGMHIDPNRPDDIAWGINTVLEDKKKAERWGKNGRKRVLENFTPSKVAEKTLGFYKEIVH